MSRYSRVLFAGVLAAACGSPPTSPTPVAEPLAVVVSGTGPLVGSVSQLSARVSLSNGTTLDVTAQAAWQSLDPMVAVVAANGVVTGIGAGTARIRATYQAVIGELELLVGTVDAQFARDFVESTFLGFGALTPRDGLYACPARGLWSGYPRGTTVTVRLSTTVAPGTRQAIQDALVDISAATRGSLSATIALTDDPNPLPLPNETTVTTHPQPSSQGCGSDIGCTFPGYASPGVLVWSRVVLPANQTVNAYVHDTIGHGLMGMCHVDGAAIGGPERSLMSGGPGVFSNQIAPQLSALDIAAARTAFGSLLNPGASWADFLREGLIGGGRGGTNLDRFGRPFEPQPGPIPSLPISGG